MRGPIRPRSLYLAVHDDFRVTMHFPVGMKPSEAWFKQRNHSTHRLNQYPISLISIHETSCGLCAIPRQKHLFLPWYGTQSRTRPLQNHARPSANPSRAHDHVRTAPGTGQSQQDGATTTSTDARRRPTRPTSHGHTAARTHDARAGSCGRKGLS